MYTGTALVKYYDDENGVYTRDSWIIPENGTDIWCTAWERGRFIKPYGDGRHVTVGVSVYHCDELLGILEKLAANNYTWGIDGVSITREQNINGRWKEVPLKGGDA